MLRAITINLCEENTIKNLLKWINIFLSLKGDIIFLQEISTYDIEKLAFKINMKILNINNLEQTCIMINPKKVIIIDNNHIKVKGLKNLNLNLNTHMIYIGNIHLSDIPSITHHLNDKSYKSSVTIPLSYTMPRLLTLCKKNRLPRIKEEMKKISEYSIIAGDFNEPSHLDIDINVPISNEFEKNGFIDSYRFKNSSSGNTWPSGKFYQGEPEQRVDFIYTKNFKIIDSFTYETNNWLSDHKMIVTDLKI
uniref:Endonuclease/exonuclease/phosphatase domain-containing protein n=1 Tax=viral metagenome TaxID=1070528 RepID=A0A6C0EUK1_9ZZZZ